ncbi:DUF5692 family protein [Clostridium sp. Marseille-P2415]|uniref:DUF5692 family protein n=1 Tax=Clostridium sp. Marseille-P2415 TaxID=1805471 RepID=UPI00098884CB|nr:DUF5692 family protein [Clostridium sp. Marseille-P2415]
MFVFHYGEGASLSSSLLAWLCVFAALFLFNEVSRRYKVMGVLFFVVMPVVLSALWFTVLRKRTYTDWFHLAKVYSATAGCIGFWLIRYFVRKRRDGTVWRLADSRIALCFPPLILAVNILEAVTRDIQVGITCQLMSQEVTADVPVLLMGGPWNFMNAAAGLLNIVTITGWSGICLRKVTKKDGSRDMLWPDMLWFWIAAYDLWNFAYTYNCLPHHAWYCGLALLLAPTVCSFTIGKGAWLQHRAHTLALWCMFAQTFPMFQDTGRFRVDSTYNPGIYFAVSLTALLFNAGVTIYMVYKARKSHRNPYTQELYIDLKAYHTVKILAEESAAAR